MAEPAAAAGFAASSPGVEDGSANNESGVPLASLHADLTANVDIRRVVVLSFRQLQLRRIAELQDELLGLAVRTARGLPRDKDKDAIDEALSKYADALRNYETLSLYALSDIPTGATLVGVLNMGKAGTEPDIGAFTRGFRRLVSMSEKGVTSVRSRVGLLGRFLDIVVTWCGVLGLCHPASTSLVWVAIRHVLGARAWEGLPPSEVLKYWEMTVGKLGFRELDQKGREERSQRNAFTQRIVMAMFGGVALIGPMLVMTLHPSRNTSLITVSVATFLFALLLAFLARDSAGKDVLGATAAYAAVLVVFVGTSMSPSA